MSGIGSVSVPQVQVPNYSGLGAIVAQAGTAPSPLAALTAGLQAGQNMNLKQQELGIQQQTADTAQRTANLQQFQANQKLMADQAYSVSQLPADQQEGAYKLATLNMVKAGVLQPTDAPDWDQGGKEITQRMALQSPMAMQAAKMKLDNLKTLSEVNLQNAQVKAATVNTAAKAQENGLNPDGTQTIPGVNGGGKPLNTADAKALNSATSTIQSVGQMRQMINQDQGSFWDAKLPRVLQTDDSQKLGDLQDALGASVGTMIGSNRLSEQQQQIALGLVPTASDTPATRLDKLDRLETMANNLAKGIRPYTNTMPGVSPQIQQYMQQYPGMTPQQVQSLLNKRGNS